MSRTDPASPPPAPVPATTVPVVDADAAWMGLAIAAAAGPRRSVGSRPLVGAAVVASDGSWWTGCTDGTTGSHAEVVALRHAGGAARGATAYITLEPCAHHGVTPPCADALIAAGVRRVVVALLDPDPRVAGRGLARMEAAGIEVAVGTQSGVVEAQLAAYLTHRRTGRPRVVLKLAASLDGRTAAPDGSSRWITGPAAREDAHRLRAECDAVLVGAGTVRADDPELTVRLPDGRDPAGGQPIRVVLGAAPTAARVRPCVELSGPIPEVLDELGRRGVLQVMVEGGASVAAAFHRQGLVDHYVLYLAPVLFGGADAHPVFTGGGAPTIADVFRGRIGSVTPLGDDLRIDLVPPTRAPGFGEGA